MHKKLIFGVVLAGLMYAGALSAETGKVTATTAGIDESIEPSDSYILAVNGHELRIIADKPFELPANGTKIEALLKVEPLKTFRYGGIELQYPRHFTFEADLSDKDVSLWSLSGPQCVLMIQRYPADMNHKTMAEMLLPRFGEGNSLMSECSMNLNGNDIAGSKIITTIGESSISQEIFSFKVQDDSLLLIIQDTLGNGKNPSEETLKFKDLLSKTFKLTPAG